MTRPPRITPPTQARFAAGSALRVTLLAAQIGRCVPLVLVAACTPTQPPLPSATAPVDTRAATHAVGAVLDDWHAAAAAADEARYFALLTDDAMFLGTDATERWDKAAFQKYAHPHFAAGKAWSFRASRRAVVIEGDIAWFDEDLQTLNLGPARGSGVLRRGLDGAWRIAQYNLAITVPNERFDDVRTLLREAGSPAASPVAD